MSGQVSRRGFIALAGSGLAVGLGLGGCGGPQGPAASGSTLATTWRDPRATGQLRVAAGEPFLDRTELSAPARATGVLATLAHVTDAHVLDASSPARVPFLRRLGHPFQSTFRPHETLTSHVLDGAARAVRALRPDLVIQGGDLIDNDQRNELTLALGVLAGGTVRPGSGPNDYYGVQLASDPDPFYYRPDVDAPVHPGLLRRATRPFTAGGLGASWVPVLGDHDALVAGELVPTAQTRSWALGDQAIWHLPTGLALPSDLRAVPGGPDGPLAPLVVNSLLTQALRGPTVTVPADPRREQLAADEVVARLALAPPKPISTVSDRLDYTVDVGEHVRLIVLDLARRGGGSGGLVAAEQPVWLAGQLSAAGDRHVIVVSHQPLAGSVGGDAVLALLDRAPAVIATICGHTHRNLVTPRANASGGYWQIETASLIDYPQQARALRVLATTTGVAIETWMLDHIAPGGLGQISRQLSYLDARGGRPAGFAGTRRDRNVRLYLANR